MTAQCPSIVPRSSSSRSRSSSNSSSECCARQAPRGNHGNGTPRHSDAERILPCPACPSRGGGGGQGGGGGGQRIAIGQHGACCRGPVDKPSASSALQPPASSRPQSGLQSSPVQSSPAAGLQPTPAHGRRGNRGKVSNTSPAAVGIPLWPCFFHGSKRKFRKQFEIFDTYC